MFSLIRKFCSLGLGLRIFTISNILSRIQNTRQTTTGRLRPPECGTYPYGVKSALG